MCLHHAVDFLLIFLLDSSLVVHLFFHFAHVDLDFLHDLHLHLYFHVALFLSELCLVDALDKVSFFFSVDNMILSDFFFSLFC